MIDLNKPGELIIKQRYSPRMKLLLAVMAAVVLLASAGFIYNYGLNRAGFEAQSAQETQQTLQDEMRKLQDENRELQESLARSQRTIQMDQAAYQDLDKSLKASAQEIVKLREELNFYRNIISPADKKSGLRIQNLYIEPAGGANQFRYKLVLIQALKHESTVQGRAIIEVSGMQVGEDTLLRFPAANERPIQVNFKYFQDIEGKLELPRNFQPKRVKVYIKTSGGTSLAEATYAWPLG
jgi:ATPase subunit of ABC transporter with duplicated ATPase domains